MCVFVLILGAYPTYQSYVPQSLWTSEASVLARRVGLKEKLWVSAAVHIKMAVGAQIFNKVSF